MDFRYEEQTYSVKVNPERGAYRVTLGDRVHEVTVHRAESGDWVIAIDGVRIQGYTAHANETYYVALKGAVFTLSAIQRNRRAKTQSDQSLTAPMPGQITKILVSVGDRVIRGQPLVLMEAMKMEIRISAPQDATIERMLCTQGQIVERGQALVELK
jgi:biotin carboxyl carrier protein